MKRLGEILTVALLLAGLFYVLLPHTDPHDAVIAAHERQRDIMATLAAHKLDSAQAGEARADSLEAAIHAAKAAKAAISLPPPPALILTAAGDSVQIGDDFIPVDPRLMRELRALVAHDAALHRLLSADSLTITRQDALIQLRTSQVRQAIAAAIDYRAALVQSDSALALVKDEVTTANRQKRVAIVGAILAVGAIFLLHR